MHQLAGAKIHRQCLEGLRRWGPFFRLRLGWDFPLAFLRLHAVSGAYRERFCNLARPHAAHNGKTPYEALREKL